jgi:uncharacterized membrane protein YedE/YeeE
MENFTPASALIGGMLIGIAAVILMAFNGRIAGISGIVAGLSGSDSPWRLSFIVGLLAGPYAVKLVAGWEPQVSINASLPTLIVAGLLVGFGTRLGSGCTSGHGVCGLARLSPRSLVATLTFMTVAAVVVFVARHVFGGGN